MKSLIYLLAFLLPLAAVAVPVSCEQARTAVGNWLVRRPGLGCRLGAAVAAVRTCAPTNGVRFHVARLAGGGFVVTSADTRLEPVIAFSDSDDLREKDDNPLWSLLKGDLAARAKALGGAALQSVAPGGAAQPTAEETRWAALLKGGAALQSLSSVSDIRVDPLILSQWGQSQNSVYSKLGGPCYNYYTPNNYVCGCVATALAQLMRYHRHPVNPMTVAMRTCAVDGVQKSFTMMGGPYDFDAMKLVPEAYTWSSWYEGGATEAQRQAIGRLTYDCGVAMQMAWASNGSSAGVAPAPLKDVFGYQCAHIATAGLSSAAYRDRILRTNLDAGYPVLLGIDGPSGGHEVLADGYGFSSSVLYTHLNMGWSGSNNAWYALPDIATASYTFNALSQALYNVFPDRTGEIVSGRVTAPDGTPIEGAAVAIVNNGHVSKRTTTNPRGIYSFVVSSPPSRNGSLTYTVQASVGGSSASRAVSVKATSDSRVELTVGAYLYDQYASAPTCGNVLCGDLVLTLPRTETATTEVPVPYAWLDANFPGARTEAEYEVLALADADGDGYATWQEYLCGTNPSAADDRPRCAIAMDGAKPVVSHNVVVPDAAARAGWRAVLLGSDDLAAWEPVADAASGMRFFKVVVEKR